MKPLKDGNWEAGDDQDLQTTARDLNGAWKPGEQRGQPVRKRRYNRKVLRQGR